MDRDQDKLWREIAEVTLETVAQHSYTRSMLSGRLPKKTDAPLRRGDRILMDLRCDLETEMFRAGGPRDVDVFFPPHQGLGRQYPYNPRHLGRKYLVLSYQEWREIAEGLDQCRSCISTLLKLISGNVHAKTLDRAIRYQQSILRAKMALEPFARKHLGDWAVLYPE